MMHSPGDQDEWLRSGARSVESSDVKRRCVGCGWTPGIHLAVDHGEARVRDGESAIFVDGVCVGGCSDVEGVDADDGLVF